LDHAQLILADRNVGLQGDILRAGCKNLNSNGMLIFLGILIVRANRTLSGDALCKHRNRLHIPTSPSVRSGTGQCAASTQNQALTALFFLYREGSGSVKKEQTLLFWIIDYQLVSRSAVADIL
jgi:hypothetical protein